MQAFKVTINRLIDNYQPGFVECTFQDAFGNIFTIEEKVPVVTELPLDEHSTYPQEGVVACEVTAQWMDDAGCVLVKVSTIKPWAVETVDGLTEFVLRADSVTPLK